MRKFTLLFFIITALCTLLVTACSDSKQVDEEPVLKPEVKLEQTTLTADAAGGTYSIAYTITNGAEGVDIEPSTSAEWISELATDGSTLTFNIAENTISKRRSAQIAVSYPEHEKLTISITQSAFEGISFNIEITEETSTSCTTYITPSSEEIIYIANMAEVSYLLSKGITTPEALYEDDRSYIMRLVEEYEVKYLAEFMYLNSFAFMGEANITWAGMMPNSEYVLYIYAIEFNEAMDDYKLASNIYYEMLMVDGTELRDVEFDVNVTVNGPDVTYEFAPVNWDGKYYLDIYAEGSYMYLEEGTTPDETYCTATVNNWLSTINYYMTMGYGPEQLLEIMCLQGPDSYKETRLADTKYMISFYAIELVDGIPQVVSKPYITHFKTGVVEPSDMTIELKVENLYVRVADITVTPSANAPYTIGLIKKSMVPEGDNASIINWLVSTFQMSRYEGEVKSHMNNLDPETEYSLFAFGYHGNIVTTDLFRLDFKTEVAGECENSVIRIDVVGPYSPRELAQADPDNYWQVDMYEDYGFYMMYSEIITEYPSADVFHYHYEPSEFVQMGYDGIFDDLTSYTYSPVEVIAGRSGVEFIMCGVTMDYRGNYSEMWMSEPFSYNYSADNKRPISELLDKINATRNASLVYHERTPRSDTEQPIKELGK